MRFQDKVAIVTGGNSGMGKDVAGGTAKNHLPQSALCIGALHQQVRSLANEFDLLMKVFEELLFSW